MRRSLRFWTRYTWDSSRTILLVLAVMAALLLIGVDSVSWGVFASAIPYGLLVCAALCMVFINYSSQLLYVPLLLSMGETRRNIFIGFHYYRVLITGATVALCALVWALAPGQASALGLQSLPAITAILVLSASVGSAMGTIFSRWPWMSMLCVMLMAGVAGGMSSYFMLGGIQVEEIMKLASAIYRLPWWLAALAAAALAADAGFQWGLLRRQEVRL